MEREAFDFFEQRTGAWAGERKRLQEEGYGDEADFAKIRENIYGLFRTVLSASMKKYGDDEAGARAFFLERLAQIPSGWSASYERARQHEDVETMHIESIKLEVVKDIRENLFQSGREGK